MAPHRQGGPQGKLFSLVSRAQILTAPPSSVKHAARSGPEWTAGLADSPFGLYGRQPWQSRRGDLTSRHALQQASHEDRPDGASHHERSGSVRNSGACTAANGQVHNLHLMIAEQR